MSPPSANSTSCSKTQFTWSPARSCLPITEQQISCIDSGVLPPMYGTLSSWTIDNSLLQGKITKCKIRSLNSLGWSEWSDYSIPFQVSSCNVLNGVKQPSCTECRFYCRLTGCSGCCKNKEKIGKYWKNVFMRLCYGVAPNTARYLSPEVKYCHVHEVDKNRRVKTTKMVKRTIIKP